MRNIQDGVFALVARNTQTHEGQALRLCALRISEKGSLRKTNVKEILSLEFLGSAVRTFDCIS